MEREETVWTLPAGAKLVAKDLQTLATSDIVRRLCPAPSAAVAAKAAKFAHRYGYTANFNRENSVKLDKAEFHVFGMLWEPDILLDSD